MKIIVTRHHPKPAFAKYQSLLRRSRRKYLRPDAENFQHLLHLSSLLTKWSWRPQTPWPVKWLVLSARIVERYQDIQRASYECQREPRGKEYPKVIGNRDVPCVLIEDEEVHAIHTLATLAFVGS
jgi:hypothetical protein